MNFPYRMFPLTETALTIQFPPQISWELTRYMYSLKNRIDEASLEGIRRIEVTFYEMTLFYYSEKWKVEDLQNCLENFLTLKLNPKEEDQKASLYHIPVCYDAELALDLLKMERQTGMNFHEIVHRHTQSEMRVFMLGFLPGFMYLGGMDERLACPRHDIPREMIPEGSVGIAGRQTGIYPMNSPGGWNIVGRTPLQLFPRQQDHDFKDSELSEFLIQPLDRIRFFSISRQQYEKWKGTDLHSFLMMYKGRTEWD